MSSAKFTFEDQPFSVAPRDMSQPNKAFLHRFYRNFPSVLGSADLSYSDPVGAGTARPKTGQRRPKTDDSFEELDDSLLPQ
ncbi:hypothetical protein Y032_0036g3285 [Ancylostoma ceylanicum]|uniref:Uncharacterized protein n=1 Tax=Ancylostoma ceylanicum TaxID=53326 RepID=A0A016UL91_9BILA|nr:hypothetical protein Y032_0036g3285 [Ancylostoma ceylanicum]